MHTQHRESAGRRLRFTNIVFPLLGAILLLAGAETASAMPVTALGGASGRGRLLSCSALESFGIPLSLEECGKVVGGDVRMALNAERTRLTVNVIDNEYEARLGRIPPKEVYEIDVHNRVVDTIDAPFMPTAESRNLTQWAGDLTSKPDLFPEGNWLVTGARARNDKFGPYMIATGAVGQVEVYMQGADEGKKIYLGTYKDVGYAIHANTIPFEYSKSYGCLVVRQADLARLAGTLIKDRQENANAVQTIRVRNRQERD
jgi:hypothetical protein